MKMNELNAIFTNLVAEYIVAGYNINVDTMGGSQGEIGKVDLRKGDEIIRVLMVSEMNFDTYMDDLVIRIGSTTAENSSVRTGTIWNQDLVNIGEHRWCKVDRDWFVEMNEAEEIAKKRRMRYANRMDRRGTIATTFVANATEIAVRYLKRKTGKRITKDCAKVIKVTENGKTRYSIAYFSQCYKLA